MHVEEALAAFVIVDDLHKDLFIVLASEMVGIHPEVLVVCTVGMDCVTTHLAPVSVFKQLHTRDHGKRKNCWIDVSVHHQWQVEFLQQHFEFELSCRCNGLAVLLEVLENVLEGRLRKDDAMLTIGIGAHQQPRGVDQCKMESL